MKKQTQSGFAVVGVAVVALVLLAGAAYTFKNAGTDSDPVGKLAQSLSIGNVGVGSGGSGAVQRPCVSCTKLANEYRTAYITLLLTKSRNDYNDCMIYGGFEPGALKFLPSPLRERCENFGRHLKARQNDVINAYNRYNNCVQGAKKKGYKVCEHSLTVDITEPPVDLKIK